MASSLRKAMVMESFNTHHHYLRFRKGLDRPAAHQ